ncbi:MAG: nucleotide exchange factor GrpE [Rickettsiales bacterium]
MTNNSQSTTPEAANENDQEDIADNTQENAAETQPSAEEPAEPTVESLSKEIEELRDQLLRANAETENVRKRSERERAEASKYAISGFARDMVSVLENLKRASDSVPEESRADNELLKTIGEGVDLTLQELLSIFDRYEIKRIDPIDQKFDHNFHQAVAQVERHDIPAGMVVQVIQAGYTIHDRLLRPAMVAVSKEGEAPKPVDTTA